MTFQLIGAGIVLLTMPWVWVRTSVLIDDEVGKRTRRLRQRRAFRAIAVFECGVGLMLVSMGNWTGPPALFAMGGLMWFASRHPWVLGGS